LNEIVGTNLNFNKWDFMLFYSSALLKQIVVSDLLFISLYGVLTRDYFLIDIFLSLDSQFSPAYLLPSVDCSVFDEEDIFDKSLSKLHLGSELISTWTP